MSRVRRLTMDGARSPQPNPTPPCIRCAGSPSAINHEEQGLHLLSTSRQSVQSLSVFTLQLRSQHADRPDARSGALEHRGGPCGAAAPHQAARLQSPGSPKYCFRSLRPARCQIPAFGAFLAQVEGLGIDGSIRPCGVIASAPYTG